MIPKVTTTTSLRTTRYYHVGQHSMRGLIGIGAIRGDDSQDDNQNESQNHELLLPFPMAV